MKGELLRESVDLSECVLDAENGTLKNVKLLGVKSKNGYKYSEKSRETVERVLRESGLPINVDHPEGENNERSVLDRLGDAHSPRRAADGSVWGDVDYDTKHPAARILERLAKNKNVRGMGFSINGRGFKVNTRTGLEVADFTHLFSIDLVDNPATTSSLRESTQMGNGSDPFMTAAGDFGKELIANPDMPLKEKRANLLALLGMLPEEQPEPATKALLQEALQSLPFKACKAAAKEIGESLLREQTETRIKRAKELELPEEQLTETFKTILRSAPADQVDSIIRDRIAILGNPKSAPRTPTDPPKPDDGKQKTAADLLDKFFPEVK